MIEKILDKHFYIPGNEAPLLREKLNEVIDYINENDLIHYGNQNDNYYLKEIIKDLFKILDDIDTASDIAKSDDRLYRLLIQNEIEKSKKLRSY